MKKILISGKNGQLITDLIKELNKYLEKYEIYAYDRNEYDVTNHNQTKELFDNINPDIFIQGASYHNVEQIENYIDEAVKTNVSSLHTIAKLCQENNTLLINFSTNYVFSGNEIQNKNFRSTNEGFIEDITPWPLNIYGILKYAGEQTVARYCTKYLNFRVSGLFGITGSRAKNNTNFPINIIKDIAHGKEIKAVNDQSMNVTYTCDASKAIVDLLNSLKIDDDQIPDFIKYGTYHLTNFGTLSWYDLAKFICEYHEYSNLKEVKTEEFYSNIKRPKYSALSCEKLLRNFGIILPDWKSAIIRFLYEYNHREKI